MKKADSLDRIADALEWRNYWDWYRCERCRREDGEVSAFDDGTGPPPPPPPPAPEPREPG